MLAGLDRMGRDACRRAEEEGGALHQFRLNGRGFLERRRQPGFPASREPGRRRRDRSRDRRSHRPSACAPTCASRRSHPAPKSMLKAEAKIAADPDKDFPIEPLGSGSDFSAFLDSPGRARAGPRFLPRRARAPASTTRATTPSSITAASSIRASSMTPCWPRPLGRIVMRAADADLPLQRASGFADAVSDYLDQVKKLADNKREEAETQAKLLRDHAFQLAADPDQVERHCPPRCDAVPHVRFRRARGRGRSAQAQRQGL